MKLLHLGDLHLGKSLSDFDLIDDQKYILDQILTLIEEESVEGVLIAGDVYDKSIPSEAATNLLDYFLNQLADRQVKTFVISGNHDSDDRLNYGSALFAAKQIYIQAKFMGTLRKETVQDQWGEVDIYMLPFVKASQVRHFFPDAKINTYEDAVRVILEHAEIDTSKRNVILAHQFVAGRTSDPELSGSEGLAVQSVGLVEKIGFDCFDDFDYVALGHIHSPQSVGRNTLRYAGSPLKYSLSEVNNEKSVPIITLLAKGQVEVNLHPLKPRRDLRHLKGELRKLLSRENITDTEDFIYATLTDEDMVNDVMGIFRQEYPNTVKIEYHNSHTKELEQVDISKVAENRTYEELVADFYKQVYGVDIEHEEMELMRAVAKEAGVIDETD